MLGAIPPHCERPSPLRRVGGFAHGVFTPRKKTQKFGGTSRPPNATRFSQTRGLSPSIVARLLLLPTLAEEFRTRTSSASNSLSQYRKFGPFLRTPLVHFLQRSQISYNECQISYNGCQISYNLTSHNIRIRSYRTYIISMSAPNAIMLAARRTYPSVVVSLSVCLRQLISIKTHICHICHICHLTNKQNRQTNKQTDDE